MATEFELLEQRVRELENLVASIVPFVPEGIKDTQAFTDYEGEKERLRTERPDAIVTTEPNTRPLTTGRIV